MPLFFTGVALGFICALGASIVNNDARFRLHGIPVALAVGVGFGLILTDSGNIDKLQTVGGICIAVAGLIWGAGARKNTRQ